MYFIAFVSNNITHVKTRTHDKSRSERQPSPCEFDNMLDKSTVEVKLGHSWGLCLCKLFEGFTGNSPHVFVLCSQAGGEEGKVIWLDMLCLQHAGKV